jgi:catechol 2,3-dioxygenase-like lactoylglutathione lyase family enzyme
LISRILPNGTAAQLVVQFKAVDAYHLEALANGGRDDGAPGLRPKYEYHYYGAFARDPDGNKIEA